MQDLLFRVINGAICPNLITFKFHGHHGQTVQTGQTGQTGQKGQMGQMGQTGQTVRQLNFTRQDICGGQRLRFLRCFDLQVF